MTQPKTREQRLARLRELLSRVTDDELRLALFYADGRRPDATDAVLSAIEEYLTDLAAPDDDLAHEIAASLERENDYFRANPPKVATS